MVTFLREYMGKEKGFTFNIRVKPFRVSKVFEGLPIYLRVCYEGQALKIA